MNFGLLSISDIFLLFLVDPESCSASSGSTYVEGDRFYDLHVRSAADVIFVVDESGSTLRVQQWIREVVLLLDNSLQANGIGVGEVSNQFALVGYGRMDPETVNGTVLTQLTSVSDFIVASEQLVLNGNYRNGYNGIYLALDQIQLRSGALMARVMVLVTDQSRSVVTGMENSTRSILEEQLRAAGFILNVVVRQSFIVGQGDSETVIFGMDFNGICYTYDAENELVINPSCQRDPSPEYENTYEDYVQLAYSLRGSAWDVQAISQVVNLTSFSRSFVNGTVEGVRNTFRYCVACTCQRAPLDCEEVTNVMLENCEGRIPNEGTFHCFSYFQ